MLPDEDHRNDNHTGRRKPHGPHPLHGPGHRHDPPQNYDEFGAADGLYCQVLELKAMGASDDDLHALIDNEAEQLISRTSNRPELGISDPGRGDRENPVDPMERARTLLRHARKAEQRWIGRLGGKEVLIVAEFPPHILHHMLRFGIKVTQIHPPTPEGDPPPHFYHLPDLKGVLDFKGLAELTVDVLLFEGLRDADGVYYVSPIVPVALRMFPDAEVAVLNAHHRAPHMSVSINDKGFKCIPNFE